jgi:hypothetical protein
MGLERAERIGDENMTDTARLQPQDQARLEEEVVRYVAQRKGWKPEEYRIELHGFDGPAHAVVWVIHRDDETDTAPGVGKSVELHVDCAGGRVLRELAFQ